jgi:hypothetical protein
LFFKVFKYIKIKKIIFLILIYKNNIKVKINKSYKSIFQTGALITWHRTQLAEILDVLSLKMGGTARVTLQKFSTFLFLKSNFLKDKNLNFSFSSS